MKQTQKTLAARQIIKVVGNHSGIYIEYTTIMWLMILISQ